MASVLPADLIAPRYDEASLADVMPALFSAVATDGSVAGPAGQAGASARERLGIEPVRSAVLLLADGLGANLLQQYADAAPVLAAAMADNGRAITAGFPTTTTTSLATLGVGAPAGVHGMTGYQVRVPGTPRVVNALQWDPTIDPIEWQPHATVLERADSAGVAVTCVAPPEFAGSGLTVAALRGGDYVGAHEPWERVEAARVAQRRTGPCLTYVYHGAIDRTGHTFGCHSPEWLAELARFDAFVEDLASTVPSDGVLMITADHGMVDVDQAAVVDAGDDPALRAGIEVFAGEGRCRYLHTRPGAARDVLEIWRDVLPAEQFAVLSREQVIDGGLVGRHVSATSAARIGDVVVLARGRGAVFVRGVDSRTVRALIGQHGSLTADEVYVPLIAIAGTAGRATSGSTSPSR